MENFLASRPSIAKLSVPPKSTANLFSALANRSVPRPSASPKLERLESPSTQPAVEHLPPSHEAQVELVREDGVVQRIVVVCKCGDRIELDCVY